MLDCNGYRNDFWKSRIERDINEIDERFGYKVSLAKEESTGYVKVGIGDYNVVICRDNDEEIARVVATIYSMLYFFTIQEVSRLSNRINEIMNI